MRVREYALEQIHWLLRRDPWVREILLAAGLPLDGLAERILDIAYSEDAELMLERGLARWERILGITPAAEATMEERRAALRMLRLAQGPPSVETLQAVCDAWRAGAVGVSYDPGAVVLWYLAGAGFLEPEGMAELRRALDRVKPAHLVYHYGVEPELKGIAAYGYPITVYADLDVTVQVPE